jgi:hypothetical protein
MPVVVMPDGHEWGRLEGPPRFALVDLPRVSVERVLWLLEGVREETDARGVAVDHHRRFRVHLEELTAAQRQRLRDGEVLAVGRDLTATDFAARVEDRVTEERAEMLERDEGVR